MKLSNTILHTAKADSRRFARGVQCRIIYESEILDLISRYNLKPVNIVFDAGITKWYAMQTGHFLAIPVDAVKKYENLKKSVKSSILNLESDIEDVLNSSARATMLLTETPLIDYLRQKLILVSCQRNEMPDNKLVNPLLYDIVIDTIDIGLGKDCKFIPRSNLNFRKKQEDWSK